MPTVLLVDDETELVRVLKEACALQLSDAAVHSAVDYDSALGLAETLGTVDVLLTDQLLGERSGLELIRALRERFPHMQALVYTGKATPAVEAEASALGAKVLWKPQRLSVLFQAIRDSL